MPFKRKRTKSQRFTGCPINSLTRFKHFGTVVEETLNRTVNVEILWNLNQLLADFLERLERNSGLAAAWFIRIIRCAQASPSTVQPVGLIRLIALTRFKFLLQMRTPIGFHLVDFSLRNQTFCY